MISIINRILIYASKFEIVYFKVSYLMLYISIITVCKQVIMKIDVLYRKRQEFSSQVLKLDNFHIHTVMAGVQAK